jgi:HD-GYP domain-containing protein (c-di-GMP phosphodiesterase class II)
MVSDVLSAEQVSWVRGHHERWDGGGYPDGLAGAALPEGARILIVADAFDAMTTDRPYRPGRAVHDAFREVLDGRGGQFPPEVVDAMTRVVAGGRLTAILGASAGRDDA